jgi:hypothetical protein
MFDRIPGGTLETADNLVSPDTMSRRTMTQNELGRVLLSR